MAHKLDSEKKLWEKAAAFHGHVCPGLTIGYRAALYAIDLLGLTFSDDEQVVCITENDACGVDAIQAILGCSIGKGNLLFHMRGKQAFSFYNRKTGKSEPVAKPQRKVQVVNHDNRCQMLFMANIPNDLQNLILILNIQTARRLIEQQELRLLRQRTRQHHLLPFPSG